MRESQNARRHIRKNLRKGITKEVPLRTSRTLLGPPLAESILGGIGIVSRAGMQFAGKGRDKIVASMAASRGIDPADEAEMNALKGTVGRVGMYAGGAGAIALAAGQTYLNVAQHQRSLERSFGERASKKQPIAEMVRELRSFSLARQKDSLLQRILTVLRQ